MFLRNHWYVAAFSHELTQEFLTRDLLGEPVLLYRKSDGTPVALQDRCPHRRVKLSRGKRVNDGVKCGYHGLEFNAMGACTLIPGQAGIPAAARVKSYRLQERDGYIWLWFGDDEKADQMPPSDMSRFYGSGYARHAACFLVNGSILYGLENALDSSHIAYVHESTFAGDVVTDFPARHEVVGDTIVVRRDMRNLVVPPLFSQAMGFSGPADRSQETHYWPPYEIYLHSTVAPAGNTDAQAVRNTYFHAAATPVTNTSYWIFFQLFRDFQLNNQALHHYFCTQVTNALKEDNEIVEEQQRNWDDDGRKGTMVDIAVDAAPLALRRLLLRLYREQNQGVEVPMPWCPIQARRD